MTGMTPRPQIAAMRETLAVWHPLFDRLVALWCETVEGELPRLACENAGELVSETVVGGWPCQRWPVGWDERRRAWLKEYYLSVWQHQLRVSTGPRRAISRGCAWCWKRAGRTAGR